METVALYDVDSTTPNLALARIARAEGEKGNRVVRYDPTEPLLNAGRFDRIYASKIFTRSDGRFLDPERMEIGGTGVDLRKTLPPEIERLPPDWSLWPGFKDNLGFAMRGCRRRCDFCFVPEKEGRARPASTIKDLLVQDSDFLILLDNDFFGNPEWRERVDEIHRLDLTVNLSQGINVRSITDEQARALAGLVNARPNRGGSRLTNLHRTRGQFHFAWDNPKDEARVVAGISRLDAAGIKRWRMACYVLIGFNTTPAEDEHRVQTLRRLKIDPFVMPYDPDDARQARFARWANDKAIFGTVRTFSDYDGTVRYRPEIAAEPSAQAVLL
ncbi:MAG: radical SAM protein [Magnetospirillum sp.]|nr:radical SAM protein [Magnetospirillum sp.]